MKKIVMALILVLALCSAASAQWPLQGDLFAGAVVTNPAANTVLVTTGAINYQSMTGQLMGFHFIVTSSAATDFRVELVNASNGVNRSFIIKCPANTTRDVKLDFSFFVPNDWSLRIVNAAAVTGSVQAVIITGLDQPT